MTLCKLCGVNPPEYPRLICKSCRSQQEQERRKVRAAADALKLCTFPGCTRLRYAMPSQTVNLCKEHWSEHHRQKKMKPKQLATKERIQAQNRASQDRYRTVRRYGVVLQEELDKRPNGECDACGRVLPLQIDHCHDTGAFRGLVCGPCNKAMGHAGDSIERLELIVAYLRRAVS